MSQPQGVFGLEVPPGGVLIPVSLELPATIHISMAAIDPTAEPEADAEGKVPSTGRSTLRIVRRPLDFFGDEEEDEDDEYLRNLLGSDDDEEDSDDEPNGGPSDPSKARRKQELRALLEAAGAEESDEDEEMEDAASSSKKGKAVSKKGKEPATAADSDEDSEEDTDDEDDEDLALEDFVLCTLDTEKLYQQPLEITIEAGETVFFTVSGSHSVHLTGNYAIEEDDEDSDEDDEEDSDDDEYDLPPGVDLEELDSDEDVDELDELDAITNRIEEVESDEEEEAPKPASKKEKAKGKKRAAEDAEPSLEDLISKEASKASTAADEKLSKKQAKKLKNNQGDAVAVQEDKDAKDKKRVQFAKTLEQGPTGSAAKDTKEAAKGKTGVKVVQGVTIDDRKVGSGRVVKSGDRVGMRYIGKLENGKVFDSNKKGAPFSFRVGKGEVIRGWDIGIAGMAIGGERRLTIPASLAYGNRKLDGIPANSTLIFDVKLLEIK